MCKPGCTPDNMLFVRCRRWHFFPDSTDRQPLFAMLPVRSIRHLLVLLADVAVHIPHIQSCHCCCALHCAYKLCACPACCMSMFPTQVPSGAANSVKFLCVQGHTTRFDCCHWQVPALEPQYLHCMAAQRHSPRPRDHRHHCHCRSCGEQRTLSICMQLCACCDALPC